MSERVMKVSALVRFLKSKLDNDGYLQRILVSGEISNFVNHRSGHWYFTLKDEQSRLSCVMFSSNASRCNFIPKDGDKVIVQVNTSIFETSGQLQLYCTAMKQDGLGDLHIQFELLKKKLLDEGYFDENHKKAIPLYPMNIGVITGRNTAAREDVISTLKRRWPLAKVIERHTLVQGDNASIQIITALEELDKESLDVLLLVRGGGSLEDLWAFNDENLAKCIYNLNTPIITGVGHEIDYTIVDFVSDKRAPTPTGAAELTTPNLEEVKQNISLIRQTILQRCTRIMQLSRSELNRVTTHPIFKSPEILTQQKKLQIDYMNSKLYIVKTNIQTNKILQQRLNQRFNQAFSKIVYEYRHTIQDSNQKLNHLVENHLKSSKEQLGKKIGLLDAYSPLNVLKRGYAVSYYNDRIVNSITQIHKNDELKIRYSDGEVLATVKEIN